MLLVASSPVAPRPRGEQPSLPGAAMARPASQAKSGLRPRALATRSSNSHYEPSAVFIATTVPEASIICATRPSVSCLYAKLFVFLVPFVLGPGRSSGPEGGYSSNDLPITSGATTRGTKDHKKDWELGCQPLPSGSEWRGGRSRGGSSLSMPFTRFTKKHNEAAYAKMLGIKRIMRP
jgi:hypothetical protein